MKVFVFLAALFGASSAAALAQKTPAPAPSAAAPAPNAYQKFTEAATAQRGLFTIWRTKDGTVALELRPDQLDTDYVELGVPVNGIGGGIFSGITDIQNCRILRFVKSDNRVAIIFPTTRFLSKPNTPEALAIAAGTANTVAGVAKVLATDDKTGDVVFDAAPFLQDITNVSDFLTMLNGGHANPMGAYRLDQMQTYFGPTKSFPDNIVLTAEQTFDSANPQAIDTMPDGRNVQIAVQYDIATLPPDHYMPRIYDDRVGYFVNAHQDFSSDNTFNDAANYIVRWNVDRFPVVYYLSNTIPYRYRAPIRNALLTWNRAFARIGYPNAVVVKDQPSDPSFDPDDIRYNVVRWLTEKQGGFAEAQLLYNPYTGEMLKSGIVIDSDLMRYGKFDYPLEVSAEGVSPSAKADEYEAGERQQFSFGMSALAIMSAMDGYAIPEKFADQFLDSIVLHESGHDFGLRHNFIGSQAYTAKDLQSAVFTAKYGVSSSVMEYAPINLWPKGMSNGAYFSTALGPYDYYAIKWGYARIPGATTPQSELPTLHRWASAWSQPYYRYSSDEDTSGDDPRNQQWDLTNDDIGWCRGQMQMAHDLLKGVDRRFPRPQGSFDDLRQAFSSLVRQSSRCGVLVSGYLGGEYISRALRGDPHSTPGMSPIPKATQGQAFKLIEQNIFAASAWNFSPQLLRQLVTQYLDDDWNGTSSSRHDISVEGLAAQAQQGIIAHLFAPSRLQRLDDMHFKYGTKATMGIEDLFTWMQSAVYGDLTRPAGGDIPLIRRNLQRSYAVMLSRYANSPAPGTPPDAQALARYELGALSAELQTARRNSSLDLLSRAHVAALSNDVSRALHAQTVITANGG